MLRGMEVLDRQFETLATHYALTAFIISTFGALIHLALIQVLLLKIHYSKPTIKAPTSLELCAAVTVLWCFHRALDTVLGFLIDTVVLLLSPEEILAEYQAHRRELYSLMYWTGRGDESATAWAGIILLCCEVLTTLLISQSVVLLLDTIAPIFSDIRMGNHKDVAVKLKNRVADLLYYLRGLYNDENEKSHQKGTRIGNEGMREDEDINFQLISLKRLQMSIPDKGQRVLNWDLTIDKNALNEMKETLGPPGGFGELGFNVASDRVSFGAVGIGTSFNLTFVLEACRTEISGAERRRNLK